MRTIRNAVDKATQYRTPRTRRAVEEERGNLHNDISERYDEFLAEAGSFDMLPDDKLAALVEVFSDLCNMERDVVASELLSGIPVAHVADETELTRDDDRVRHVVDKAAALFPGDRSVEIWQPEREPKRLTWVEILDKAAADEQRGQFIHDLHHLGEVSNQMSAVNTGPAYVQAVALMEKLVWTWRAVNDSNIGRMHLVDAIANAAFDGIVRGVLHGKQYTAGCAGGFAQAEAEIAGLVELAHRVLDDTVAMHNVDARTIAHNRTSHGVDIPAQRGPVTVTLTEVDHPVTLVDGDGKVRNLAIVEFRNLDRDRIMGHLSEQLQGRTDVDFAFVNVFKDVDESIDMLEREVQNRRDEAISNGWADWQGTPLVAMLPEVGMLSPEHGNRIRVLFGVARKLGVAFVWSTSTDSVTRLSELFKSEGNRGWRLVAGMRLGRDGWTRLSWGSAYRAPWSGEHALLYGSGVVARSASEYMAA